MCGLVGYLGGVSFLKNEELVLQEMSASLFHRGPDAGGTWHDTECQIGLGHRRLSIVDLSDAGHQPMHSPSGRYVIIFNGEIYNHREMRSELESLSNDSSLKSQPLMWKGHSDTETLLSYIEILGLEKTLKKAAGMFAIALWDRQDRTLTLARDRLGEKPIYYGWQGDGENASFLFGSELKGLKLHPSFVGLIDRCALRKFINHGFIPAPRSIYQGISKLEPGTILTVSLENRIPQLSKYWSVIDVAINGVARPYTGSPEDAVESLDKLLRRSVKQQMMADVPLGGFLSGGVDSSTVIALMQVQSETPIKTFTIGFNEPGYNEAEHAKQIAKHLGTDHTELYVTSKHVLDVIPSMATVYCEPFADSSQLPTYLVSKLAKKDVTVYLSGDGGDELFCGYNRYLFASKIWSKVGLLPTPMRQVASGAIKLISPEGWDRMKGIIPSGSDWSMFGDKVHKFAKVMSSESLEELYSRLISNLENPSEIVIGGGDDENAWTDKVAKLSQLSDIQRMMLMDTIEYLPDDILTKIDRAGMATSIEGRVPFLDHRVIEFAWSLPQDFKIREQQSKWILRQVLYKYMPKSLIERPKMGFSLPIHNLIRGPLREWAENLIDVTRLKNDGYFNHVAVHEMWNEHMSGKRNWVAPLWSILMFQSWLESRDVV